MNPFWITNSQLGTYPQYYNFGLVNEPLVIEFYAEEIKSVTILNGTIPEGLSWVQTGDSISITGTINEPVTEMFYFTFRIVDGNGFIADRTFYISIIYSQNTLSWENQNSNFGYLSANNTYVFETNLTIHNKTVPSYAIESEFPIISVNSYTGNVTIDCPILEPNTTQLYSFQLTAEANNEFANIFCYCTTVGVPHAPIWINTGLLGSFVQGTTVDAVLETFESSGQDVTYSIIGGAIPDGLTFDNTGVIYGIAPKVNIDTVFNFEIAATSVGGTTTSSFSISILYAPHNNNLSQGELGNDLINPFTGNVEIGVFDGQIFDFYLVGNTASNSFSTLSGGKLPPDLNLYENGRLYGFIDFSILDKDYWFEITTNVNGRENIQKYHMKVISSVHNMMMDVKVPIQGEIKLEICKNLSNSFTKSNTINFSPEILISGGLNMPINNIEIYSNNFNNYVKDQLRVGLVQNSNTTTFNGNSNNYTFFSTVIDPQQGANVFLNDTLPVGSINAWRSHLQQSFGYAGNNFGSGAQISLTVDQGIGNISNATIVDPGTGFFSSPLISVNGDGSNALITATLGLSNINILDTNASGNITIDMGIYTIPSQINVSNNSAIILNQGSYTQFPFGESNLIIGNEYISFTPTFSINQINIVMAGNNYTFANAIVGGGERLPDWMEENYQAAFEIGTLDQNSSVSFSNLNNMNGSVLDTNFLHFEIKGYLWTGTSGFDFELDNEVTDFQESISAENTTFDTFETQFDGVVDFFTDDIDHFQNLVSPSQKTKILRMKTRLDSGNVLVDIK